MNQQEPLLGTISLIQKFSVQDGPGIRTTVFMKGCPLKCYWCQNPETWSPEPELMTRSVKCKNLKKCIEVCPENAIYLNPDGSKTLDRQVCNLCFKCTQACPTGALVKVGEEMTVEQIMKEVSSDENFFYRSGGGVTVSGGEPLMQGAFVLELLKKCKEAGFHTALDTCGHGKWSVFEKMLPFVDLILYDIKHLDPDRHKEGTGVDNILILSNLRRIPKSKRIWLRLPLIPGFNDTKENLTQLAALAKEINAEKISVLPFHKYAEGKYDGLGRTYPASLTKIHDKAEIDEIMTFFQKADINISLGS